MHDPRDVIRSVPRTTREIVLHLMQTVKEEREMHEGMSAVGWEYDGESDVDHIHLVLDLLGVPADNTELVPDTPESLTSWPDYGFCRDYLYEECLVSDDVDAFIDKTLKWLRTFKEEHDLPHCHPMDE